MERRRSPPVRTIRGGSEEEHHVPPLTRSLVYYLSPNPTLVPTPLHHLAPGGTTLDFLRTLNCSASFAVGYNLMALPGPLLLSL